jgi:DNA-directed RNA polymerase subunit RPC12/RpoP
MYEWNTLSFSSAIAMKCPTCKHVINIPKEGLPGRCPACGYWHLLMGTRLAVSWEKMEYFPNG